MNLVNTKMHLKILLNFVLNSGLTTDIAELPVWVFILGELRLYNLYTGNLITKKLLVVYVVTCHFLYRIMLFTSAHLCNILMIRSLI